MDINQFLIKENLDIAGTPGKIVIGLYELINTKKIINFYSENDQDFDRILYEFIRTNSGGTKLSFADLLMSIITANWEEGLTTKGAREDFDEIIKTIGEIGFIIDQDFILKTCLILFSKEINFSLKNFNSHLINDIKLNWGKITQSIVSAFQLIKSFEFNNQSLRAKNAIIPIIYYLYQSNLYLEINKENVHHHNKGQLKTFLLISLLNKNFGGSSDSFQSKLRKIIGENIEKEFPLQVIKNEFKGTNRSFNFDDEKIINILRTPYQQIDSFYILALIFDKFNFAAGNPNIDHLYPKSKFTEENFKNLKDEGEVEFYKTHFNTVLNLALLSEEQNKSKNCSELKGWIEDQEKYNSGIRNALLIPETIDLSFSNFKNFIETREILLISLIKSKLN